MDKIRFLHIPKTAGTSFADVLTRMYPGECYTFTGLLADDLERYKALKTDTRERTTVICGHSPRVTGIPEIDELPVITFLRDPVERVKSFCQHVSERRDRYWEEMFPPGTFDLDKFLDSKTIGLSNFQAMMLLGNRGYGQFIKDPREIVDQVMHVLQNDIDCFGIVEDYDTSLVLFRRVLGWEQWPVYRILNVAKNSKRLTFTGDQIAKIRSLNAIDIQVYTRALRLFREQVEEMSDVLQADLVEFRTQQEAWLHYLALCRSSLWKRLAIDWSRRARRSFDILRNGGWGKLQQEIEQYFRWLRDSIMSR
jgi:hypothetical protein